MLKNLLMEFPSNPMLLLGLVAIISATVGFYTLVKHFQKLLDRFLETRIKSLEIKAKHRRQAEARQMLILESIKDYAIFSLDTNGRVFNWNPGAQALKGYNRNEIIGKHFSVFYPIDDVKAGKCEMELEGATRTGRFEDEGWRVRKDGTRFWANVIISAIRDAEGQLVGFSKVTRDLTERKMAEQELRHSEGQLREAQEIAHIGSWEWDLKRDAIWWSDELFKIFGIDKFKTAPNVDYYFSLLLEDEREKIRTIIEDARTKGQDYTFEHRLRLPSGEIRFVQARGRVVKDSEGHVVKMTGTTQDITNLTHIESELIKAHSGLEKRVQERTLELHTALASEKRAKEQAEAATLAKMQFLANMSHEIRTPMNAILGFAELLNNDQLSPDQLDFVHRIQTNGSQLLRIIDDILDLSKFEAGKVPIERIQISLTDLVKDAIASLQPLAEKKNLQMRLQFASAVPQTIYSDPQRLRQILTNLLGNAIKFSNQGEIIVRLGFLDDESHKQILFIEVEDKGVGIDIIQQKQLFRPFQQGDGSVARKFGGTGLGLALSRHIATALGGELVLRQSELRKGSCFRLTLHIDDVSQVSFVKEETALETISTKKTSASIGPAHILLAEDSPDNETLVRLYLKSEQLKIDAARDGFEAVKMAMNGNYDLVLMDIQMPGLDGLEATRSLRSQGFKKPIIALTAHALREEMQRSLDAGCNLHLTKPINRSELQKAIKSFLSPSA